MQSIRTRYIGPTNVRGSRLQAKCEFRTVYFPYDHALNLDGNHRAACEHLMTIMRWNRCEMVGGTFGNDQYWVFLDDDRTDVISRINVSGAV